MPVIKDADHLTLTEISDETRRLAWRSAPARSRLPSWRGHLHRLEPRHVRVSGFDAVINPRQAGILSVERSSSVRSCGTERSPPPA